MLNLILVLKATGIALGCGERRDENCRARPECRELPGPCFGVVRNESGDFGLRITGGSLRDTAGNTVNSFDTRVGEQAGKDM